MPAFVGPARYVILAVKSAYLRPRIEDRKRPSSDDVHLRLLVEQAETRLGPFGGL